MLSFRHVLAGAGGLLMAFILSADHDPVSKGEQPPSMPAEPSGPTVKLWDAATGQESLTLNGHSGLVRSVAFSPDGKRLASASSDQTVKVWDVATGQALLTLQGHTGGAYSVAFSPNGKRLASASLYGTVNVWDAATGKESFTLKGHSGSVLSVAFSPDGKRLASASDDWTVKVWDVATGRVLLTLQGHTGAVNSVAFSPDGKQLASGSGDQTVKVWDAATGQEVLTLKGHTRAAYSVAFSPDGKRIASASDYGMVKVWDAATSQESFPLKGHNNSSVTSVAFSPDGKRLASASVDHTVKVWDAASGQEVLTLNGHFSPVLCVAFSLDGKRLASASMTPVVSKSRSPDLELQDRIEHRIGTFGRFFRQTSPMPKVTVDKDGNAVLGGNYELQVRPGAKGVLLVVLMKGKDGIAPEERFIAYPLDDRDPKGVRLVVTARPECRWTGIRSLKGKGADTHPKEGNMTVRVAETFSVGTGPLKGWFLCAGEQNSLVLLNPPTSPVGRVVEYIDLYDGK